MFLSIELILLLFVVCRFVDIVILYFALVHNNLNGSFHCKSCEQSSFLFCVDFFFFFFFFNITYQRMSAWTIYWLMVITTEDSSIVFFFHYISLYIYILFLFIYTYRSHRSVCLSPVLLLSFSRFYMLSNVAICG
jgi:hypothetical protein